MKRLLFAPLISAVMLAGSDARAQELSPVSPPAQAGQTQRPPVNGKPSFVISPANRGGLALCMAWAASGSLFSDD
jgi:hypothetical protein